MASGGAWAAELLPGDPRLSGVNRYLGRRDSWWAIARDCAQAGAKRCTVVVPTWVDTGEAATVLCPEIVREAWRAVGYRLRRVCYASKRIQASSRIDRMPVMHSRGLRRHQSVC
jgi:hypothetical protein